MTMKKLPNETCAPPAAVVQMYFGYSKSLGYRDALDLCADLPSFSTTGEGNDVTHSISVPITDIALLMRLYELVGGWKSFRLIIDGQETERQGLIQQGGACYSKRQSAQDPQQYCFGDSRLEYNLWGCKRLDMPTDEAGHGWVAYGAMDAKGVWHFDKSRIREELDVAMQTCRLCPVFDRPRVITTLEALPDAVDPRQNGAWAYRSASEDRQNGDPVSPAGIAPIGTHIAQYVLGEYRPQWKFPDNLREAKTEMFLGSVERWANAHQTGADSKSVKVNSDEMIEHRSAKTPAQRATPATRIQQPARWPWMVTALMLVMGLSVILL